MQLKNLNFQKIKPNDAQGKTDNGFGVLYKNKLFLGRTLTKQIQNIIPKDFFRTNKAEKSTKVTFYVDVSIASNIIKIDFLKEPNCDSFEGVIFYSDDGKYCPTWIGNTKMVSIIANSLQLNLDNGKFYTSVDSKIEGYTLYLEFNKNNYKVSQRETYEPTGNRIKWDRDNKESEVINLFCYVNSKYRFNKNLKTLVNELGYKNQKDYYNDIATMFNKNGDRSRGFPIGQIKNSLIVWEYHYIYVYSKGTKGMPNGGRDEEYINKFINKFSDSTIDKLKSKIKNILKAQKYE